MTPEDNSTLEPSDDIILEENNNLKARIAELESAVEYGIKRLEMYMQYPSSQELSSRAFPQKFEEVEVKRWECNYCQNISYELRTTCSCCNGTLFELVGKRTIPIPRKVKHREEMYVYDAIENIRLYSPNGAPAHAKFFAEWESDK